MPGIERNSQLSWYLESEEIARKVVVLRVAERRPCARRSWALHTPPPSLLHCHIHPEIPQPPHRTSPVLLFVFCSWGTFLFNFLISKVLGPWGYDTCWTIATYWTHLTRIPTLLHSFTSSLCVTMQRVFFSTKTCLQIDHSEMVFARELVQSVFLDHVGMQPSFSQEQLSQLLFQAEHCADSGEKQI